MNKRINSIQLFLIAISLGFAGVASAHIDDTLFVLGQKKYTIGNILIGYATVPVSDNAESVLSYSEQKSYPIFDLESFIARDTSHLRFDSELHGENDYLHEFHIDHTGHLRLSLLDESLVHLVDHQKPVLPPSVTTPVSTLESDSVEDHRLQYHQQDVGLKYTPSFLTSHITLRYHHISRIGDQQLRYLDENCTSQCHIVSRSRAVKQRTDEVFVMADAHLGGLELGIDHLQRTHDNQAEIPVDSINNLSKEHDSLPDNRYQLTTFKIHNSLAGGLVAAGSLSAGTRRNDTDQSDGAPILAQSEILKGAGDLTWTPSPLVDFSFRYRISRIDNDVDAAYLPSTLIVPEAIDVTRNLYGGMVVFRPTRRLMVKGDYQHEQIHRQHTQADSFWVVPKVEKVDRLAIDLDYRPFLKSTTRLNLGYLYKRSSDPAYAMSDENTYIFKAGARFTPSSSWGVNANLRAEKGENGGVVAPLSEGQVLFDRSSHKKDLNFNAWMKPSKILSIGTTLGYSHLLVEQDLRFGRYGLSTDVVAPDAENRQILRTASLNTNLAVTRRVNCNLDLYHIRGSYHFSPEFLDQTVGSVLLTDADLQDINSIELKQNGLAAGLQWQAQERLTFGLRYVYDKYHDVKDTSLDSTVQSYMLTVAKSW